MKHAVKTLKQHPIAIICFAAYIWLWVDILKIRWCSKTLWIHAQNKIGYGEYIAYTTMFASLMTVVFVVVLLIFATYSKDQSGFYWVLSGLAIAPPLLLVFL